MWKFLIPIFADCRGTYSYDFVASFHSKSIIARDLNAHITTEILKSPKKSLTFSVRQDKMGSGRNNFKEFEPPNIQNLASLVELIVTMNCTTF